MFLNPKLDEKGMLVVYNPLKEKVTRTITVPLYYTGLDSEAKLLLNGGKEMKYKLDRDYTINLTIELEAESMKWVLIK